jgi:uncharacterized protein (TIGR00297 family)
MPPQNSGGETLHSQTGGRPRLHRTTQFSAADLLAIVAAATLVSVHCIRHQERLTSSQLLLGIAIAASFAVFAWMVHGVSWSGAVAGSGIAFIFVSADLRMFWELLLLFAVTFLATHTGKRRKEKLRLAEASAGRSASQVMANLGVAGLVVSIAPSGWPWLALAALAEAAADTSSSEIGMAFPGKTVLLTSWKPFPPGVDGGVSLIGTVAAILAAVTVSMAASVMHLVSPRYALIVMITGVVGSFVDSVLGALLERRGFLNNDLVNLLSTTLALAMAAVL